MVSVFETGTHLFYNPECFWPSKHYTKLHISILTRQMNYVKQDPLMSTENEELIYIPSHIVLLSRCLSTGPSHRGTGRELCWRRDRRACAYELYPSPPWHGSGNPPGTLQPKPTWKQSSLSLALDNKLRWRPKTFTHLHLKHKQSANQ